MKKLLLFMLVSIAFYACRDRYDSIRDNFYLIRIVNNSSIPIYYYIDGGNAEFNYPDTSLPTNKQSLIKIKANDVYYYYSKKKWEDYINDMPKDTMSVYFFDADVYENTDWNEIRTKYMVLKRYSIDVAYLKNNNYTIVYP